MGGFVGRSWEGLGSAREGRGSQRTMPNNHLPIAPPPPQLQLQFSSQLTVFSGLASNAYGFPRFSSNFLVTLKSAIV